MNVIQQGHGLLPGTQPVIKGGSTAGGYPQLQSLGKVLRLLQSGEETRYQGIPRSHGVAHLAAAGVCQVQLSALCQQEGSPTPHGHQYIPGTLYLKLMGQLHALGILQIIHPKQSPQFRKIGLDQERVAGQALPQGFTGAIQCCHASLLHCLAENRGRVVPVRTIYETVWHETYMPASNNTVMVHIVNLRKKLEEDPANPRLIRTVWGKGYQID